MAFEKMSKEFVLSDSSVNVYGYRLLTSGYIMEEFLKNPIGYYGHDKSDGVLLRWEDLRLDGDLVKGFPVINLSHPRAERTIQEVNDGFLNAASVGKLVFVDCGLEDNVADPANPVLVVRKWYNKECSLVDNPGNRAAMKVELEDTEGNVINLNATIRQLADPAVANANKNENMDTITLPVNRELLELIDLSDAGELTAEAVLGGIKALRTDKAKLEKDLADVKASVNRDKVKRVLAAGMAEGRLSRGTADKLEKQFADNPADLADIVSSMPAYQSIAGAITHANVPPEWREMADKSWDELHKSKKMEAFKQALPDLYEEKRRAKFGK